MTPLTIQSAFLNQPIEMAEIRSQFQSALGLGNAVSATSAAGGHFGLSKSFPGVMPHLPVRTGLRVEQRVHRL